MTARRIKHRLIAWCEAEFRRRAAEDIAAGIRCHADALEAGPDRPPWDSSRPYVEGMRRAADLAERGGR